MQTAPQVVATVLSHVEIEGLTFREIYNNVRKELARTYLAEKNYTIDDISYLLGFSEPSVFRKAFKAWTGMTPGHFRSASETAFIQKSIAA